MPGGKVLSGQYLGYHSTGCHVKISIKKTYVMIAFKRRGTVVCSLATVSKPGVSLK